ncbi:hypothetical protein [Streptomyces chumphonensis]|uniref:hypothetical protein n=1 Tax=Streptomyces chumphonensis TaxID=1214925 RepID=UPI003D73098D
MGGVLAVLVVLGLSVRAPVEQWWLAREACGGELPADDLEIVRSGVTLGAYEESYDAESGRYVCALRSDEDQVVVAVETFPRGRERERELSFAGSSHPPHALLPGGLPGWEDGNSLVYLMPECPGRASDGEPYRLPVSTWTYFAHSPAEQAAMLRLAVRMTNGMTEKLGCGGEPLPAPQEGAVPYRGAYVPRAEVEGTACASLATADVPEAGPGGVVRIAVADGGVVGRCTLYAPGGEEGYRDSGENRGRPLVELTSWRGTWAGGMRDMGSGPDPLPLGEGADREPESTTYRAWAVARCEGEDVGYAAHWGYDYPYQEPGTEAGPSTEAQKREWRERLRGYVTAFAEDQVRRGDCTDLRVPRAP